MRQREEMMQILGDLSRLAEVILLDDLISVVSHPFAPRPSRTKILFLAAFTALALLIVVIIGYVFVATINTI